MKRSSLHFELSHSIERCLGQSWQQKRVMRLNGWVLSAVTWLVAMLHSCAARTAAAAQEAGTAVGP